jgi:hypothetical protein
MLDGHGLGKCVQAGLLTIVGLGIGFCAGFAALLVMVRASNKAPDSSDQDIG